MSSTGIWHRVQRKETLTSIARTFGISSWRIIYDDELNRNFRISRTDPNSIFPGDMIWLPGAIANKAENKSGEAVTYSKKPPVQTFTLDIVDMNDSPINIVTEVMISYSDASREYLKTTGSSTKIKLNLAGKVDVFFYDGWVIDPTQPTFWRKWGESTVSDGSIVRIKVLILTPGDILLREGPESDSTLIMKISGHPYSHAGMVVRDSSRSLKAIDAYPGRDSHAIGTLPIEDFFSTSHAKSGVIIRYSGDTTIPQKASEWALLQIANTYEFDLIDEFTNNNNRLYCSEFVWRCYKSQGVDLVPIPINFLTPDRRENTINALIDYAYEEGEAPKYAPRSKVRPRVEAYINKHGGKFIAPYQLAESRNVQKIVEVATKPQSNAGASASTSKKM